MQLLKQLKKLAFKTETEESNSQTSASEPTLIHSSQLIHNEPYNEIIWIRGSKEVGYFATISNMRITTPQSSTEKVIKLLDKPSLYLISTLVEAMININEAHKETSKEQTNN